MYRVLSNGNIRIFFSCVYKRDNSFGKLSSQSILQESCEIDTTNGEWDNFQGLHFLKLFNNHVDFQVAFPYSSRGCASTPPPPS